MQISAILHLNTFGAFPDFSFLTTSPCWATRSYRPEAEEPEEAEEAGEATGDGAEEVAVPGL